MPRLVPRRVRRYSAKRSRLHRWVYLSQLSEEQHDSFRQHKVAFGQQLRGPQRVHERDSGETRLVLQPRTTFYFLDLLFRLTSALGHSSTPLMPTKFPITTTWSKNPWVSLAAKSIHSTNRNLSHPQISSKSSRKSSTTSTIASTTSSKTWQRSLTTVATTTTANRRFTNVLRSSRRSSFKSSTASATSWWRTKRAANLRR